MKDSLHVGRGRNRRIFWLRLLLSAAALLGTFAVEAALLFAAGGPAAVAALGAGLSTSDRIAAGCGVQDGPACDLLRSAWLGPALLAFAVIAAAFMAWRARKGLAEALDDRLFADFDLGRFDAIGASRNAAGTERPLPWMPGLSPLRRATWEQLLDFTLRSDIASRHARFSWTMLTGQPGIGKSRMAERLAHALAAREAAERPQARAPVLQWLGRALPLLRTRGDDRWHAGRLRPRLSEGDVGLGAWRPARATLLLLDDPAPGEAEAWIGEFHAQRRFYRFPVRLLIVNQSRATRDAREAAGDRLEPLGRDAQFDIAEIRDLLERLSREPKASEPLGGALRSLLYPDKAMTALMSLTRGNPFLVELCIEWARDRLSTVDGDPVRLSREVRDHLLEALDSLTAQDLIRHRAERVVRALAVTGINMEDPPKLHAIAAATLVGPHARRLPIVEGLDAQSLAQGEPLRRIVPSDTHFDDLTELPCILPHAIGDAAVRLMLESGSIPAHADDYRILVERVAAAGFRANPGGWMRAKQRFAGRTGMVAEALRILPSLARDASLKLREDMARAYMELGLFGYVPTAAMALDALLAEAPDGIRGELVGRLRSRLDLLVAADSAARDASFLGAPSAERPGDGEDLPAHRFINGPALTLIGMTLIAWWQAEMIGGQDDEAGISPIAALGPLLAQADARGAHEGRTDESAAVARDLALRCLIRVSGEATLATIAETERLFGERLDYVRLEILIGLAARLSTPSDPELAVRHLVLRALSTTRDMSRLAAEEVDRRVGETPSFLDREAQLWRAKAWRNFAYRSPNHPDDCSLAVETVENIAGQDRFKADGDFQHLRASAWCFLAEVMKADPARSREAAERVEHSVAHEAFPDDEEIQNDRLVALNILARMHEVDVVRIRDLTERVEEIAARRPFAVSVLFQRERAEAWERLSSLYEDDPAACRAAVDMLEQIVGQEAFAVDRSMQFYRVAGHRNLAFALRHAPAMCRAEVDIVEQIAGCALFADDPEMQMRRAAAWRHLAFCLASSPAECRWAVGRVEDIAAADCWVDDPRIQEQRVIAWHFLAHALKDDPAGCRAAVLSAESIAGRESFAADRPIQLWRARAWRRLALALRSDPDPCRLAVDRVAEIVANPAFRREEEFEHELDLAQSILRGAP